MNEGPLTPLPQYQSHKKVWALKISKVELQESPAGAMLHFDRCPPFAPRRVSEDYIQRHHPQAGGYWVQYEGGYESWSPADAFESGHTEL